MRNLRRPPASDTLQPPSSVLGRMARACDRLARALGEGGSAETDRFCRILADMAQLLPGELADRGACARSLTRASLAGMADRLARAADLEGWRFRPDPHRTGSESALGAAIARMRLVARNLG